MDIKLKKREKENVRFYLSSRTVAHQVLSALCSLTSVFGMGTGGPCTSMKRTLFHSLSGRRRGFEPALDGASAPIFRFVLLDLRT